MKDPKAPRVPSESSTTSDNTSDFIDIVKKYDVIYNTHNPDYKNVEIKQKIWAQIAEEIGLSVEASKRKWKNLRDSYTKYLRSFRVGTKTSKKYQFWAHADHMDFLKPYQGPGRNSAVCKSNDEDDTECDLGYQVLAKATNSSSEEDMKMNAPLSCPLSPLRTPTSTSSSCAGVTASASIAPVTVQAHISTMAAPTMTAKSTLSPSTSRAGNQLGYLNNQKTNTQTSASASAVVMPLPALPAIPVSSQTSTSKHHLGPIVNMASGLSPVASISSQILPLTPATTACNKIGTNGSSLPSSSNSSSVGCLIIEPQLFASTESFKKEMNASTAALGLLHSIAPQMSTASPASNRASQQFVTKIRRVHPSQQTASAINLSYSTNSAQTNQPPPIKVRRTCERNVDLDVTAVLQANRDLDANTLFFLSLARQVRSMPTKSQSLAKMRCMHIISDIELELESAECTEDVLSSSNFKYANFDTPPPPSQVIENSGTISNEGTTEHFLYVMSPSRVENMIDISSDEESIANNRN